MKIIKEVSIFAENRAGKIEKITEMFRKHRINILAMNIAFIVRNRLDYLNHQAAATIIIISFLFFAKFEPIIFLAF